MPSPHPRQVLAFIRDADENPALQSFRSTGIYWHGTEATPLAP